MSEPSIGVIYMVFGDNARKVCEESLASLRRTNPDLPVAVLGDDFGSDIQGVQFIRWELANPYNATKQKSFQFQAGIVKPHLYNYSPFDYTLYLDADTEIKKSLAPGFALLDHYDLMYSKHSSHNIGMLNNMPSDERLTTIKELGSGDIPYPNSGVIFWKRGWEAMQVFQNWYKEWLRFKDWDEQLALMRAVFKNPCRVLLLPEAWNGENQREGSIIFHDFHGQQRARSNVPLTGTFTQIHDEKLWPSKVSKSGSGSDIENTVRVREMLPVILKSLKVKTILDAGCGDWNWMSKVDLEAFDYHGCDIVPALIQANKKKYPEHAFFVHDLTVPVRWKQKIASQINLILCRSVLFHLSFDNVNKVLANFKKSKAEWLLTTTYPYFPENANIQDGKWHRLNLEKPPFNFPAPYLLMPEGLEVDGWLGLWKLADL